MVEEARAYRERVLGELARRRDLARQQIEQLVHGRDRLLQAFERARLVAVDVTAELSPLGEPDEYVDLTPTTGPVPIMVPSGRIGEATSVDDFVPRTPETDEPDGRTPPPRSRRRGPRRRRARPPTSRSPARRPTTTPIAEAHAAADRRGRHPRAGVPVPAPAGGRRRRAGRARRHARTPPTTGEPGDEIDDDDVTATDVDALFAKLRANPPTEPEPALDDAEPTPSTTSRRRRSAPATPCSCRSSSPPPASSSGCSPTSRTTSSTRCATASRSATSTPSCRRSPTRRRATPTPSRSS